MKQIAQDVYVNLGKRLKKRRKEKGYSLRRAAELVGCSNPTIMRVEKATHRIENETLVKYCEVLDLDVDKLISDAELDAIFDVNIADFLGDIRDSMPTEKEEQLIFDLRELPPEDQQKVYDLVEDLHREIDEDRNGEIRREKEKR